MKKTIISTALIIIATALNAQILFQSNFSNWASNKPTDWYGSKTNLVNSGDSAPQIGLNALTAPYCIKLINSTATHKRFTTQPLSVTNNQAYEVKFWALGKGDIRTALYKGNNSYGLYNNYISVNTTTWTPYTQYIISDTTSTTAEFILSVAKTAAANGHLLVDSVVISAYTPQNASIYQIQNTTAISGESPLQGSVVTTGGIVTGKYNFGYFIQSSTGGPWSGIHVSDKVNTTSIQIGDTVNFTAMAAESFSLTQLQTVINFQKVASGITPPNPITVSTLNAGSEQYEGVLVKVINATCNNANLGNGEWQVNDGSGNLRVDDLLYSYSNSLSSVYNVTGPIYYSFSTFKVTPRDAADIELANSINDYTSTSKLHTYPNPATNYVHLQLPQTTVNNVEVILSDITGKQVLKTTTTKVNNYAINTSALVNGIYFLTATQNNQVYTTKIIIAK